MSELTDRLRTIAAVLAAEDFTAYRIYENETQDRIIKDAHASLLEAAEALEEAGVGMVVMDTQTAIALDVIPPHPPPSAKPLQTMAGVWYDNGPTEHVASRNACPNCDSRANKTVRKGQSGIMLECPVCGSTWKKR